MLAGTVYLCAVWAVIRKQAVIPVWTVLLVAIICRLILIPSLPLCDDDIYRYIWDGRVLSHRINPFIHAPASESLAFLRDSSWAHVNYSNIRTIYPPAAQLLFAGLYLAGLGSIWGMKLSFMVFDIADMMVIVSILRVLGRPQSWVLIYAWSPLAIKEFANSGHIEPVMLFALLLAVYYWIRKNPNESIGGIWFGLSAMFKLVPLLLMTVAFRLGRWRSLIWTIGAMALCCVPFVGAGSRAFSGAAAYGRYWEFNDGLFALLATAERHAFGIDKVAPVWLAKIIVGVIISSYAIYSAYRLNPTNRLGAVEAARNLLALVILLAPAANPWYVCWVLPFLAIAPNAGLLLLCVTCNLSYLFYVDRSFPEWIAVLEYLPVYMVLAVGYLRRRAVSQKPATVTAGESNRDAYLGIRV
jgi:hypothetical protein